MLWKSPELTSVSCVWLWRGKSHHLRKGWHCWDIQATCLHEIQCRRSVFCIIQQSSTFWDRRASYKFCLSVANHHWKLSLALYGVLHKIRNSLCSRATRQMASEHWWRMRTTGILTYSDWWFILDWWCLQISKWLSINNLSFW